MLIKDCRGCEFQKWMVGIGFGVRCKHPENQKYINMEESHNKMPVIISNIPNGCTFKKLKEENE